MFEIMKKLAYKFSSIFLLAGILSNAGLAQEQIGVASAVNKNTTDLTLEQERKLIDAGYEIIQNHTIETDGIGRAQMLLLDGTAFSVGPNSSVVLDKFIYNPETAEGSLEVTARGLLRIVGGKVTKKQPALIRTNSATVGIRGGIGIVQTNGPQTNATFLYGTEMTVTPNCVDLDSFGDQCSPDYATTVTEPGFSVSVESEDSEPSEPVAVTEESLDALQEELEVSEEAPEEESAAESPAEENQEEESLQKKLRLRRLKQTRELQAKRQQLRRLLAKMLPLSPLRLKLKHLQRLKPKSQVMMPVIQLILKLMKVY
jgi:flagellar biosynthesis GTPase FlhF